MSETMQNESPKHQNVVNTRGKPGKNNANANRHEIQKKIPKRKKKEFPNQLRSLNVFKLKSYCQMFEAKVAPKRVLIAAFRMKNQPRQGICLAEDVLSNSNTHEDSKISKCSNTCKSK